MNSDSVLMQPLRTIQFALAALWLYQGLVPKILFQSTAELQIWQNMGVSLLLAKSLVGLSGLCEILLVVFQKVC